MATFALHPQLAADFCNIQPGDTIAIWGCGPVCQMAIKSAFILGAYDKSGEVTDRAVRVADVSLKTLTADVVVLSACETALGPEVRVGSCIDQLRGDADFVRRALYAAFQ